MIEIRNLTKRFPLAGGRELTAVNRVSFTVADGEVYGLLGPNGAGKTTTIRMLLGLLRPTSGHAYIDGFSSQTEPDEVKRRVGLVSATAGLNQWLTVRELLEFSADVYGVPPKKARHRLDQLGELLGLDDFLDRRCVTLSTGQKQRVQLARALIHQPPVLLLDEPTSGLDVLGSQAIVEYVGLLRREGKSVIITTHRLDEAERLCDRFGLLHKGKLVREGTLDELRRETGCTNLVEMFLALSGVGPLLPGAAAVAEEEKLDVVELIPDEDEVAPPEDRP
jgi:ABC-2 type transport system ATP-binding protein/sodium transport system ATP-binding protein